MPAALAEVPVRSACDPRLLLGHRSDQDPRHADEVVELPARDRVSAAVDDCGRLQPVRRGDLSLGRLLDGLRHGRGPALVVEQLAMLGGAEGLLEARSGVPADGEEAVGQAGMPSGVKAVEALADRDHDGGGLALTGELREFSYEPVGFLVLDVQAHSSTFLPLRFFHGTSAAARRLLFLYLG